MTTPRIAHLGNDFTALSSMHALLTDEGYRTLRCRPQDVLDVHAVVKRARPALVILDLWLAERDDGWAFLNRMCTDCETAHIPAIIAHGQRELLRTMACPVLAKPFDTQELRYAIKTVLGPSPAPSVVAEGEDALIAANAPQ